MVFKTIIQRNIQFGLFIDIPYLIDSIHDFVKYYNNVCTYTNTCVLL